MEHLQSPVGKLPQPWVANMDTPAPHQLDAPIRLARKAQEQARRKFDAVLLHGEYEPEKWQTIERGYYTARARLGALLYLKARMLRADKQA